MPSLTSEQRKELQENANKLLSNGKGILAADESMGTAGKRLSSIGMENTEENRIKYRQLLFEGAPDLCKYLGGVILFEETVGHSTKEGKKFVDLLRENDIMCGIKLDRGTVVLPSTDNETTTQGLDGLSERCKEFYEKGCRFAKWRCVYRIGEREPSPLAMQDNAEVLARYASICQQNGLVPIVEPEILMDGDHCLERSIEVGQDVISSVYRRLIEHNVYLEGTLLKPSMVCPGQECEERGSAEEIGLATVRVLQRSVPVAVPGICFLSGGQSEAEATANLAAINRCPGKKPWRLSFSYARALQHSTLKVWNGEDSKREEAMATLLERAKINSEASEGIINSSSSSMSSADAESLYVSNYSY